MKLSPLMLSCLAASLWLAPTFGYAANEPTNAKEAAAEESSKDEQEAALSKTFATWKATLSPEQQAWETVLEENLGGYYLPRYMRAKTQGRVTAWDYVKDDPSLPSVLLIGDSISRGYTIATRNALAGKANVHRAPANCGPTATALKHLDVWLGKRDWDVIHFNFGIHDRKTPLGDYESRLRTIVKRLQARTEVLIWASTTPIPDDWQAFPDGSKSIVDRNAVAASIMKEQGIVTDDLYAVISPRLAEVQIAKDVHFKEAGCQILGAQVAKSVLGQLAGRRSEKRRE